MELNKTALLSEEKTRLETDPLYPEEIKMYSDDKYRKLSENEPAGSEDTIQFVLVFLKFVIHTTLKIHLCFKLNIIVNRKKQSIELTFAENKLLGSNSIDLLAKLKKNNIKCQILDFTQHLCVVLSIENTQKALDYIANYDIFVPTVAEVLVRQGRRMRGCTAAHRTYLPSGDEDEFFRVRSGNTFKTYEKATLEYWSHVYLPYASTLPAQIYKWSSTNILSANTTKKLLNISLNNELDLGNDYKSMLVDIFVVNASQFSPDIYKPWKCFCFMRNECVSELKDYYGASVGFYFAFCRASHKMLLLMSVMGMVCFLCQIIEGQVALKGLTAFMIVAVLTVTFWHIHVWIRHEMKCMIKWGVIQNTQRQETKWCAPQPNTARDFYCFSLPTLTCFICSIFSSAVNILIVEGVYKNSDLSFIMVAAAGILIGILIFVLNSAYLRLTQYVHTNDITVYHQIFFFFINSFCSLYYLAFFQEDYEKHTNHLFMLQSHIICVFITICICRNLWKFLQIKAKCCANTRYKINDNPAEEENELIYDIRRQLSCDSAIFKFTDNMLHKIVICYGFMILFIAICPIITVFSLLVCTIEIRVDLWNLILHSRRQLYAEIRGIGVWNNVFHSFTLLSVITNMSFITFKTDLISDFIDSEIAYTVYFIVITVLLLALLYAQKTFFDPLDASYSNMLLMQDCCMKFLYQIPLIPQKKEAKRAGESLPESNELSESRDELSEMKRDELSESNVEECTIHHDRLKDFPFFKIVVETLRGGAPWEDPMTEYDDFTAVEYEYYYNNFKEFKSFDSGSNIYKENFNTFDQFDDMHELFKDAVCDAMSQHKIFPFDGNVILLRDDANKKCYVVKKQADFMKIENGEKVQDITKNFVRFARYVWLKEMVLHNQDDEFNIFRNICFDMAGYKQLKEKLIDNIPYVVKYKQVRNIMDIFSSNIFDSSDTFLSKIKMFLCVLCVSLQLILTTAVIWDVADNWDYDKLTAADESVIYITSTAVFIGISFMTSITIFKFIVFYKYLSVICSIPWIIAFFDFISNVVIGIAITSVSFFFLVQSETLSDVVLNSFALTFILELDDIINRFESDEDYIIQQEFSWVDDLSSFAFFDDYGYNFMFKRKIILPVNGFSDVLLFFVSLPMFFIFSLLLALKALYRLFNCNNFYDRTSRTYVYDTYYQSLCVDGVGRN